MKTNHFALAFAFGSLVTACGGVEEAGVADDTAGTEDSIIIVPTDFCKTAAADATGSMGSNKVGVEVYSGAIDYSNDSRLCRRFVADIYVPGTHQTPSGSSDYIDLYATEVGSNPNTQASCEAIVVNARFYQRTDTLFYNGNTFSWVEGSFSSLGSAQLRGNWITNSDVLAPGCYVQQVSGSFPAILGTGSSLTRRVARVAVEGHVETANGNLYGLSVKGTAHHAVSFDF